MVYIVRALVYLLQTALGASGVDLTVTAAQSAPSGAPLLGTTTTGTFSVLYRREMPV